MTILFHSFAECSHCYSFHKEYKKYLFVETRIKKWPIVPDQLFQTKVLSNW